jgi:hypothetical protein
VPSSGTVWMTSESISDISHHKKGIPGDWMELISAYIYYKIRHMMTYVHNLYTHMIGQLINLIRTI